MKFLVFKQSKKVMMNWTNKNFSNYKKR